MEALIKNIRETLEVHLPIDVEYREEKTVDTNDKLEEYWLHFTRSSHHSYGGMIHVELLNEENHISVVMVDNDNSAITLYSDYRPTDTASFNKDFGSYLEKVKSKMFASSVRYECSSYR